MKAIRTKLGMTKGDLIFCLSSILVINLAIDALGWYLEHDVIGSLVCGSLLLIFTIPFALFTFPTQQNNYGHGLY